jgi:hypothetical protein
MTERPDSNCPKHLIFMLPDSVKIRTFEHKTARSGLFENSFYCCSCVTLQLLAVFQKLTTKKRFLFTTY